MITVQDEGHGRLWRRIFTQDDDHIRKDEAIARIAVRRRRYREEEYAEREKGKTSGVNELRARMHEGIGNVAGWIKSRQSGARRQQQPQDGRRQAGRHREETALQVYMDDRTWAANSAVAVARPSQCWMDFSQKALLKESVSKAIYGWGVE